MPPPTRRSLAAATAAALAAAANAVAPAAAWTSSPAALPTGRRRPSPLSAPALALAATEPDAGGAAGDGEARGPSSSSPSSLADRRGFFARSAAAVAASSSLPLLAPRPAGAADASSTASSSYSRVYHPAPHSMDGKVVVVTGGNAGLGLESTKRLAAAGATVVFTSRDEARGKKALGEVEEYLRRARKREDDDGGGRPFRGRATVVPLDLCDLSDVKSFRGRLERVLGKETKIDVLMNNAGVMAIPDRRITKDGYEQTFQTNHLGHFALTSSLLPLLSPEDGRIINVSSIGYQFAAKGLELDNLNGEREYGPWSSYGLSKLENILFTNELQRRADALGGAGGGNLRAYAVHPGAVQTDLARYLIGEEKFRSMKEDGFASKKDELFMKGLAKFVKTVEEGASTQVYLASSDDDVVAAGTGAGKFFSDGRATKVQKYATDEGAGRALWEASERMSGVKFDL